MLSWDDMYIIHQLVIYLFSCSYTLACAFCSPVHITGSVKLLLPNVCYKEAFKFVSAHIDTADYHLVYDTFTKISHDMVPSPALGFM